MALLATEAQKSKLWKVILVGKITDAALLKWIAPVAKFTNTYTWKNTSPANSTAGIQSLWHNAVMYTFKDIPVIGIYNIRKKQTPLLSVFKRLSEGQKHYWYIQ